MTRVIFVFFISIAMSSPSYARFDELVGNTLDCIYYYSKYQLLVARIYVTQTRVFEASEFYYPKQKKYDGSSDGGSSGNVFVFGKETQVNRFVNSRKILYSEKNEYGFRFTANNTIRNDPSIDYKTFIVNDNGRVYKENGKWVLLIEKYQRIIGGKAAVPYSKHVFRCRLLAGLHLNPQIKPFFKTPNSKQVSRSISFPSQGNWLVQVASARSRREALRRYARIRAKYPALVPQGQPDIQRANLGKRGIYYRVRLGALASKQEAQKLCAKFRRQGLRGCLVRRR